MPFSPQHSGLFFTQEHIQQARNMRDRPPLAQAWDAFEAAAPEDPLEAALHGGFAYRFGDSAAAGARAAAALQAILGRFQPQAMDHLEALAVALALAQSFELVRDHPALVAGERAAWLDQFFEQVNALNAVSGSAGYVELLWLGALNLAAGVTLEREDIFQAGVERYQQVIQEDIHPEGYISRAVEGEDGQTFYRQLLCVQALVLGAEAALHAGVDLWAYHQRGVSVMTAATYLMYYYYYPEKWRWDTGLTAEDAHTLIRQHGGIFEMINRYARPEKMIQRLLDDLRPIYDPYGGGYTTLTHSVIPRRRGLFG